MTGHALSTLGGIPAQSTCLYTALQAHSPTHPAQRTTRMALNPEPQTLSPHWAECLWPPSFSYLQCLAWVQAENEGDEASPEPSADPGGEGSADTEDALGRGHAVIAELCGNSEWLKSWASAVWAGSLG